jgi:hypothetical protein
LSLSAKNTSRSIAAALLYSTIIAIPSSSENLEAEIEHLLRYVEQSGCTFIRNGEPFSADRARSHMERKYVYAMRKIESADQFIERVGSRSSRSGKAYEIRCGDNEYTGREWLTDELNRFRSSPEAPERDTSVSPS